MKQISSALILISLLMTLGCSKQGFQSTEIPKETVQLRDLEGSPDEKPSPDEYEESEPDEGPVSFPDESADEIDPDDDGRPQAPDQASEEPEEKPEDPESEKEESGVAAGTAPKKSLSAVARWVVQNESKKIGKACNFYIQRVFFLLGFGKASWLANQFDQYAKQTFKSYKLMSFKSDSSGANQKLLKNYIWSFPERTGFVMQWKRNQRRHGHIAIVERIGDQLVIYHANLNRFHPKAQKATVEILLGKGGRTSVLNVFSHFKK